MDRHRIDADPDLKYHVDADSNLNWHQNDADPHVVPSPSFTHVGKSKFVFSHSFAS
jgi:hypothetical protein